MLFGDFHISENIPNKVLIVFENVGIYLCVYLLVGRLEGAPRQWRAGARGCVASEETLFERRFRDPGVSRDNVWTILSNIVNINFS